MATKANWFIDEALSGEVSDPGDGVDVEQMGLLIELDEGEPELNEKLIATLNRESDLFNAGIRCAIREAPDTTCSACPARRHDELDRLKPLCDVGCEQERLSTSLAMLRHGVAQTPR